MNAKKTPADTLTPGQIAMAFGQIASTADVIDCLTSALMADNFDSKDDAGAVLAATQRLAQMTGLMADLYGDRCGGGYVPLKGGPDKWLMPDSFQSA